MRGLTATETGSIGAGVRDGQEAPPPPGVSPGVWNDLLARLEWERRNQYRKRH